MKIPPATRASGEPDKASWVIGRRFARKSRSDVK
jgi:hypothetical protein